MTIVEQEVSVVQAAADVIAVSIVRLDERRSSECGGRR